MGAARPDTWMPLYWGDYFKDTNHLSTAEHGAYLLMIGHYWVSGKPLPDDDAKLAQITRQGVATWRKMRDTLAEFFDCRDGRWHHGRIEDEIQKAFAFIGKQATNGSKGGRPKKPNKTQQQTQNKPVGYEWVNKKAPNHPQKGNPNNNPDETTSPSPSQEDSEGKAPPGPYPEEEPSPPVAAHGRLEGAAHDAKPNFSVRRMTP